MDNDKLKRLIGQRINTALVMRDKKQKELAAAIGVTDNTISYFCSGSRTPNFQQLLAIAKELEVSTDFLLGLADPDNSTADEKLQMVSEYTGLGNTAVNRILSETAPYSGLTIQENGMSLISVLNTLLTSAGFWRIVNYLSGYVNTPKQVISRAAERAREYSLIHYGVDASDPENVKDIFGYKMQKTLFALLDEIDNTGRSGDNVKH